MNTKEVFRVAHRFWTKVETSKTCWEWTGTLLGKGYGGFSFQGKMMTAHRFIWTMEKGPIPDGMCVLHHCDNMRCVRPSHLFIGSVQDNIDDRNEKGRTARGTNTGQWKLTDEQCEEIRKSPERGIDLAKKYGVTHDHISRIRNGRQRFHRTNSDLQASS